MWNYSRELPSNLSENFEKIAEAYMNFEYEVSWFLESDRNKMPLDIAHVMWNPDWNNIHIFNNNRSVQDREIVYSNSLDKYYVIGVSERFVRGVYCSSVKFERFYPNNDKPTRNSRQNLAPLVITCYDNSPANSCQITTLANILDGDYQLILSLMRDGGWTSKYAGNTRAKRWREVIELHDMTIEPIWKKYDKSMNATNGHGKISGMTVSTAAKKFPNGTFYCTTDGHVCTIKDGSVLDHHDSRKQRVRGLFQILPI